MYEKIVRDSTSFLNLSWISLVRKSHLSFMERCSAIVLARSSLGWSTSFVELQTPLRLVHGASSSGTMSFLWLQPVLNYYDLRDLQRPSCEPWNSEYQLLMLFRRFLLLYRGYPKFLCSNNLDFCLSRINRKFNVTKQHSFLQADLSFTRSL